MGCLANYETWLFSRLIGTVFIARVSCKSASNPGGLALSGLKFPNTRSFGLIAGFRSTYFAIARILKPWAVRSPSPRQDTIHNRGQEASPL